MKEYRTPEIKITHFDARDIITESSIVQSEQPQTFDGAFSLGSMTIDVFEN